MRVGLFTTKIYKNWIRYYRKNRLGTSVGVNFICGINELKLSAYHHYHQDAQPKDKEPSGKIV